MIHEDAAIRVQPGAANYFSQPDALDQIERFFPSALLKAVLWIGGPNAREAAQPYLPRLYDEEKSVHHIFSGHCSERQVQELTRLGHEADLVVGIGGGSALDTAKATAHRLQKPFVAIPTIAATCAAWTPLSVWYDDSGKALGYELFPLAAQLVLVEPRILLQAPPEYLRAGIGDTLAKWYEARVLCAPVPDLPLTAGLGLEVSKRIREILLDDGAAALSAAAEGRLTPAFMRVIDAVIAGGGLVGGLGERYTRLAAAHAVHNGLTVLPETATCLHGTKVAYGILVQLALEGETDELARLAGAFVELSLPTCLKDLGVDFSATEKIEAFVAHTLRPQESIHFMPGGVDRARLLRALEVVEAS